MAPEFFFNFHSKLTTELCCKYRSSSLLHFGQAHLGCLCRLNVSPHLLMMIYILFCYGAFAELLIDKYKSFTLYISISSAYHPILLSIDASKSAKRKAARGMPTTEFTYCVARTTFRGQICSPLHFYIV
jgi:hypothetical protein